MDEQRLEDFLATFPTSASLPKASPVPVSRYKWVLGILLVTIIAFPFAVYSTKGWSISESSTRPFPELAFLKHMQQGKSDLEAVGRLLETNIQFDPKDSRMSRAQYLKLLSTTSAAAVSAKFISFYPQAIDTVCTEYSWERIRKYLPWLVARFRMETKHMVRQHHATIDQAISVQEMLQEKSTEVDFHLIEHNETIMGKSYTGGAWRPRKEQQPLMQEISQKLNNGISSYRMSLDFWNRVGVSADRIYSNVSAMSMSHGHGARDRDVEMLLNDIKKALREAIEEIVS
ncbi:hypothetical protein HO133_000016 [Letharia lupina]|uniref:Uncharacterized protein n=1 Tax=Letharia lupina TaxID=560253 RepID=A0A8H6FLN2_9LECA|nr:uncharacterized protein HO133_000016 [Letharia lupina]KAF6230757.1 hypothetical protein HO133_000016 [Letharia lupina]